MVDKPTPPTSEELAEMRSRCDASAPGPWAVDVITGDIEPYGDEDEIVSRGINGADGVGLNKGVEYELFDSADAAFIAHTRTDIPRLLDEVERLRDDRNDARKRVAYLESKLAEKGSSDG